GASLSPYVSRAIGWRAMFIVWAAVAALGALLWIRYTPRDRTAAPPAHLAAVLRDRRVWQVAALLTFQNLVYYTVATWVPFLLIGRSAGYVATTFLFLNFFPIVPLFALSFIRWLYALSTPFYVVAGTLATTGSLGLLLGLTDFVQPLVFMVGLGTAAAFVASIALPPLIARDESEASTYSAVMYTAGYLLAFVGPLSAGMLVDATGSVALAFWPPVAGAVLMAVVGSLAPASRAARAGATSTLQPKPTDWRPRGGSFSPREWRDSRWAEESVSCAGSTASHATTSSAPSWGPHPATGSPPRPRRTLACYGACVEGA